MKPLPLFLLLCLCSLTCFNLIQAQENKGDKAEVKVKRAKVETELSRYQDSVLADRYQRSRLNGHYIPHDLLDCFRTLDTLMDEGVRERFMAFSDEEVDARTHASLGKWLDNRWSISEGSRLSAYFRKMGLPHPDYMVGLIIRSYHRHLHKRDLGIKEQVKAFKKDWEVKEKARIEGLKNQQKGKGGG